MRVSSIFLCFSVVFLTIEMLPISKIHHFYRGFVLIFTSPISGHVVAISAKKIGLKPFLSNATFNKDRNK